ncbi:hypothetical protein [Geobacillus sp. FJAT-46040]|nr:hypothetical protein [Geobacillus sp. FJAT-46040]
MMKRKAKWAVAASLAVGMTAGALLFTPSAMKASEKFHEQFLLSTRA